MAAEFEVPGISSSLTFDLSGWTANIDKAASDAPRVGAIVEGAFADAAEASTASMTSLAEGVAVAMATASSAAASGTAGVAAAITDGLGGAASAGAAAIGQLAGGITSAAVPAVDRLGREFASTASEIAAFELALAHADADARLPGFARGVAEIEAFDLEMRHADAEAKALATSLHDVAAATQAVKPPSLPTEGVERMTQGMRGMVGVAGMLSPALGQVASGLMAADAAAASLDIELAPLLAIMAPLIAAGAAFKEAFSFSESAIGVAASAEKTEIAFKTILGSATAATAMIKDLKAFANATPLTFPEAAQGARMLLNVGIEAADVRHQLTMLGDVATGSQTDLNGLSMIYTQVVSKGKADTMDLMQLANRGVPIYKALQTSMHLSGDEVRQLVEAGKVGFPEMQAAFEQMTGSGGQFHNAMKDSQGSFDQLMSTLSDGWREVEEAVGKVIIENLDLKGGIAELTDDIQQYGPIAVAAFAEGTAEIKAAWNATGDLRALLGDLIDITGQLARLWSGEEGASIEHALLRSLGPAGQIVDAIGGIEASADLIGRAYMNTLAPITLLVDGIVAAVKWIRETLDDLNFVGSDAATAANNENGRAFTDEEKAAAKAKGAAKTGASAGTVAAAGAAAAPGDSTGISASSGTGGGARNKDDEYVGGSGVRDTGSSGGDFGDNPQTQARALKDQQDAYVQRLRNEGKAKEADLAQLGYQFGDRAKKAETPAEKAALDEAYQAQKAEIEKKYADQAAKLKDEQAKKDEATADRIAQHNRDAIVNGLIAAGRDSDAERLKLVNRWVDALAKIKDPAERKAAEGDRDADLAAFDKRADDKAAAEESRSLGSPRTTRGADAVDTAPSRSAADVARGSPVTRAQPGESPADRNRRFQQNQSQRRLAQLDLRDDRFGLDDAGKAQRDRLLDLTGVPSFGPSANSPIGASAMPANGPRARQVVERTSTPARSPGASPAPTVNATVQMDEAKLTRGVVAAVGEVVDRKLDAFANKLKAAGYARGVAGGI